MEHKLARGALGMDSRRNDAYRRNPPASAAASAVPLGAFFFKAPDPCIQGQREPRRWPLVLGPRCLLSCTLVSVAED